MEIRRFYPVFPVSSAGADFFLLLRRDIMSVFICPVCGVSSHCGKKYEWKSGVSAIVFPVSPADSDFFLLLRRDINERLHLPGLRRAARKRGRLSPLPKPPLLRSRRGGLLQPASGKPEKFQRTGRQPGDGDLPLALFIERLLRAAA
jgi:hypothetical protein